MYNQFYFIYSLTNTKNGKRYIGYSNDLNRRLFDHWTQLKLNQHPNKILQKDFTEEDFKIEILETFINVDNDFISKFEKEVILKYDSFNNGYNQTPGGEKQGQKNNNDILLSVLFILTHYENSGVVVQKLFKMSESAVLRLKNHQSHLHIYEIVKNMSKETISNMKEECEREYDISNAIKTHRSEVTLGSRKLDRETVLQIISVCNNRQRVGGIVERHLGLASQHSSRIKRGLRYREYYDEYLKMAEEEKGQWLISGLERFRLE